MKSGAAEMLSESVLEMGKQGQGSLSTAAKYRLTTTRTVKNNSKQPVTPPANSPTHLWLTTSSTGSGMWPSTAGATVLFLEVAPYEKNKSQPVKLVDGMAT